MGTGGGPTLAEPFVEPEPDVEPDVEPEPELPRETITLTLEVELEELSDDNQEEIRNQITDMLNDLGGTDLLFEPFESGSTVVKLSSATPVSNDQIKSKINHPDDPMTITYTVENEEKTTFFTKLGDDPMEYDHDIIIIKTDNTKEKGSVGEDGIVTRAIINDMIGDTEDERNTIQSVLFGGKCIKIENNPDRDEDPAKANNFNLINGVFSKCANLTSVYFGKVEYIGHDSFAVSGIKTLNDFGNVNHIGKLAFLNCRQLLSVSFPNREITIDFLSFRGNPSLIKIDFGGIKTVYNGSFSACFGLVNIDFKNVETIEKLAFDKCVDIESIDFKNVKTIGDSAFGHCRNIVSLDLKNVETLGMSVFSQASGIETVNLGLVNKINYRAFNKCNSLKTIRVNRQLTEVVGDNAFNECPVVDGTEEHPFLIHKDIPNISFGTNNGNFSNLSTVNNGGLQLVTYENDDKYVRVRVKPQTISLSLQVDLEELTDQNQTQIRDQITDLVNELGGTDLLFEPFESGSTVVKVSSTTPINNVELINKITDPLDPKTITYTGNNGEITTFYTKIGEEVLEYKNDIIIVKTDNTKVYGVVGDDGIVTRQIINNLIGDTEDDRNTIQCLLFGGKTTDMYNGSITEEFVPGGNPQVQTSPNDDVIFPFCTNLHTINFGDVNKVGDYAFYGCNTLTQIDFKSVNIIGKGSFTECQSLVNIDFKNVKEIGRSAFTKCESLVNIDFKSVNIIGKGSFTECQSLVNIDFKNVQSIDQFAFQNSTGLTTINLNVVTNIGDQAFTGCSSLTALDLKNVQQIGSYCFSRCESIQTIDFGLLETIPNAFQNCTSLISLDFKNVQTIQDYAFADSSIQTSIDFGIVTFIGRYAFSNCSLPSTLDLKNVQTVDNFAFQDCSKVTSIDFGKVNRIDGYAFTRCLELTSIYLREVVTFNINLFAGCTSLNEVRVDFVDGWDGIFPQTCFQNCHVVDGTEEHPFLIHKDIPNISFGTNNGNFSNLSTVNNGGLGFIDYDTNYKRVVLAFQDVGE